MLYARSTLLEVNHPSLRDAVPASHLSIIPSNSPLSLSPIWMCILLGVSQPGFGSIFLLPAGGLLIFVHTPRTLLLSMQPMPEAVG